MQSASFSYNMWFCSFQIGVSTYWNLKSLFKSSNKFGVFSGWTEVLMLQEQMMNNNVQTSFWYQLLEICHHEETFGTVYALLCVLIDNNLMWMKQFTMNKEDWDKCKRGTEGQNREAPKIQNFVLSSRTSNDNNTINVQTSCNRPLC